MHEFSIAKTIFDIIISACNDKIIKDQKIVKLKVKVGELKMVTSDSLKFAFSEISKGTLADGAELIVETIPGDELYIENIEIEEII